MSTRVKLDIFKGRIICFFNNLILRNKLIVSFSFVGIFLILLQGIMSQSVTRQALVSAEKQYIMNSMEQLNNSVDNMYEVYMNKSLSIYSNTEMQKILKAENKNVDDVVTTQKKIDDIIQLEDIKGSLLKKSSFFAKNLKAELFISNETIYVNNVDIFRLRDLEKESWYREFRQKDSAFYWQANLSGNSYENPNNKYIGLSTKLVEFSSMKIQGILRIKIPIEQIDNMIKNNIDTGKYTLIYTDSGYNPIISHGREISDDYFEVLSGLDEGRQVSEAVIDGQRYLIGVVVSDITGWQLFYIIPMSMIIGKAKYITSITVFLSLIAIILFVLIATGISSIITRRVKILVDKTNEIKKDNFAVTRIIGGKDEVAQLDSNFNQMVMRINDLIENEYKNKIIVNQMRLELLQEQINPHMLYNTLSLIRQMSEKGNNTKTIKLTDNLIQFYRNTLNRGRITLSIGNEIDNIKRYIEIMQYVHSVSFDTVFEIEEHLLDLYTIKLILQPVIENAIVHGIIPKGGGELAVKVYEKRDQIVFEICDDGVGMDRTTLEVLTSMYNDILNGKGYGVSNVIKRIRLFFGKEYGVTIDSDRGAGTFVSVCIPKLDEKAAEELEEKFK